MKDKFVIGLMSGTSMDGINASLVRTDGEILSRTGCQIISNYDKNTIQLLKNYVFNFKQLQKDTAITNELSRLISHDNNVAIDKIIELSGFKPDLIGFHGQTVFHNSKKTISIQVGDGNLLARLSNTTVISNFRENDILNGGQGAPISPIYHKLLMKNLKLELPCCFLNIGGVSNISYWDGKQLIGFDLGPGNGLMDIYCQEKLNIPFDKFGIIASNGTPNLQMVNDFIKLPFFKTKYPKSIDRLEFNHFVKTLHFNDNSAPNVLATFLEFTISSIIEGIKILPLNPKKLIIMGGGQHNKFLVERIKNSFSFCVIKANEIELPGDFIEAEMIAFLAARKINNLPVTFPTTTGVKKPTIGGKINLV